MGRYNIYDENLPDIRKYSYSYITAETLQQLDETSAMVPAKIRLPNYRIDSGVIDAVDIDWQGIKVGDVEVESTGHLAYLISQKSNASSHGNVGDGIGIPVLDKEIIDELESNNELPDKYISIPTPEEIDQHIDDPIQYQSSGNGYYLDILFSSIRKLQSEVARLKNSFKYGIYSYNDENTAMSTILNDYEQNVDEEPLWATEETDLSELDCGLYLTGIENGLTPSDGSTVTLVQNDTLQIDGNAYFVDKDEFKNNIDAKQYLFMTTSSCDIKVILKSLDGGADKEIDLSELDLPITSSGRYNILFILSRSYKNEDTGNFNENTYNFVWLSIADYLTGVATVEGYYKNGLISATRKTISDVDNRYFIYRIDFNDLTIYKFNSYSKKQDFSNTVVPAPASTDEDYKYSAAHITIRSVKSLTVLNNIEKQLKKNELIYIENINTLYIKTDSGVKPISGSSNNTNTDTDTGMEQQEIIAWLAKNGIIVTEEGGQLKLNDVADITLIHEETGKAFNFRTDSEGNLYSREIEQLTLAERVEQVSDVFDLDADNNTYIRGFVGTLRIAESTIRNTDGNTNPLNETGDVGLLSDRVKIGQIYMPREGQKSFGCSHAFIELENTSDQDFQLDGCYIHYGQKNSNDEIRIYHLPLVGKIPAGGTYLIRGKQYCDMNEANVFIKVETYDIEWYVNGELIDLTRQSQNTFLLTYGLRDITESTSMYGKVQIGTKSYTGFNPHYIDSISVGAPIIAENSNASGWDQNATVFKNPAYDAVFKNNYELDPAKQAYQSLFSDKKDSSRVRGQNDTDYQILDLRDEYIQFPATEPKIHMSTYTPRASFEHKNVCTDKTQLDMAKPNMTTVSFGIDIYKTRCFNWVSAGVFDEYVWVREQGTSTWERFESYKSSEKQTFADNGSIFTKRTWDADVQSAIYNRLINTLPASNIVYSAHKAIITTNAYTEIETPVTFEYKVGRADKNGNPDPEHTSDLMSFTMYPQSYRMRIYHHTDQQGFQWLEYQAWAAAAEKMLEVIKYDTETAGEHIIPVLINTGDMTQNGTRINEWLDYYNGGKCLFSKYEQGAVVGNNDLCDTNINILGTGDDTGKSNGYYFHVAYCFEIDDEIVPVVNGKYLPSTYYIHDKHNALVFIDSEFTQINCRDWFNLRYTIGDTSYPVNIYTGFTIAKTAAATRYVADELNFTPLYNQLYAIFNKLINDLEYPARDVICACHEMPFTVVTDANLKLDDQNSKITADRSANGDQLVGSHMNSIITGEVEPKYWFSRLLEYFGIKLMIGGHKHTYACTHPLRENYQYGFDGETYTKNSIDDGPMQMQPSLEYDNVNWNRTETINLNGVATEKPINSTKFPIYVTDENKTGIYTNATTFYPVYNVRRVNDDNETYEYADRGVIYFMLQATGNKLKSNKELPSNSQTFGYVIPKTKHESATSDKPYADQQYPMFAKIDLSQRYIVLCRISNILSSKTDDYAAYLIIQQAHGDGKMKIDVMTHEQNGEELLIYGKWNKNIPVSSLNTNWKLVSF